MKRLVSKQALIIVGLLLVLGIGIFVFFSLYKVAPIVQLELTAPTVTPVLHKVLGKSVEGRNIDAYVYGNGATHLSFIGGIHGGYEWNGVALAYQFMDYLKANPNAIPLNITIVVVPSANPDGVYRVTGKEGRITIDDIPATKLPDGTGRFNAHNVDLNRNFDCNWKPKSMWKSKIVSAGTSAFSEPEAVAIRNFVLGYKPDSVVFWHSKSNAVYASQCEKGILPKTLDLMNVYSKASGYGAIKSFDAYEISGDAEGWLASINIPAITVELSTHETIEWERNLAGIKAILKYYSL